MNSSIQCGYIAIIGRPNVGKSTLLNAMIGKKISIISPKPQTTRNQILGIKTQGGAQLVFIDTPGLHKDEKRTMNRYMNRLANSVIDDADIILFMIESNRQNADDELALQKLEHTKAPVFLIINKVDLLKDKQALLPLIEKWKHKYNFHSVIPISARKIDNINLIEQTIIGLLPEGPHLFPDEQLTDKEESFQIAEFIREKVIMTTEQELPYSTSVVIESIKKDKKIIKINAIIWVEREGQKPIVIGKQGERLKKIGTLARKEIEKWYGKKVFLTVWVKVQSDWTNNPRNLNSLGIE